MKIVITESQLKRLFTEDINTTIKPGEKWLYEPTNNKPIKPGEKWFYEPFNSCLVNLSKRVSNFELDGGEGCYLLPNGDKFCFGSRHSSEQKGGFVSTPSIVKKYPKLPEGTFAEYYAYGEWWCEAGKKEPQIDLSRTKEHRERLKKSGNVATKTSIDYMDRLTKDELKKQTSSHPFKSKTMDDIKNGRGYIVKGMEGPIVKELQKMLLTLKYDLGSKKDDGIFGELTKKAVEKFQKDSGIKPKNDVYGIFGKITYDEMMKKVNQQR